LIIVARRRPAKTAPLVGFQVFLPSRTASACGGEGCNESDEQSYFVFEKRATRWVAPLLFVLRWQI